jgi:hypothetical protein
MCLASQVVGAATGENRRAHEVSMELRDAKSIIHILGLQAGSKSLYLSSCVINGKSEANTLAFCQIASQALVEYARMLPLKCMKERGKHLAISQSQTASQVLVECACILPLKCMNGCVFRPSLFLGILWNNISPNLESSMIPRSMIQRFPFYE